MRRLLLSIFLVLGGQCLAKADDAELGIGIYGISLGEDHEIATIYFNERGFRAEEIDEYVEYEYAKYVSSKDRCTSEFKPCETLTFHSVSDDYSAKNPNWRVGKVTLYKILERKISVDLLLESIEKHFGRLQKYGETDSEETQLHQYYRSTDNSTAIENVLMHFPMEYFLDFLDTNGRTPKACNFKGQLLDVFIRSEKTSGKTNSFRISLIDKGLLCDAKIAKDAHALKLENDTAKELSFD